jgi:hypothetical protein
MLNDSDLKISARLSEGGRARTSKMSKFRRSHFVLPFLVITSGLLLSCGSSTKSIQLAKDSVGLFHSRLDTQQYPSIYAAADEKFHNAVTEADFAKLLGAIHNKLGTVRESNWRNTSIGWFAGQGATVTLVYETKFSDGSGTERFVWHIKNNQATLYNYNINSNDLITK